jgi:hypothetical protein
LSIGASVFLGSSLVHANGFFLRGDVTQDERVNLSDAVQVFRFVFTGPKLIHGRCLDSLDVDDNNAIEFNDGIRLLFYLFDDGPAPAEPFPVCDGDPSPDELGCVNYGSCVEESRIVLVTDRSSTTCSGLLALYKQAMLEEISDFSRDVEFAVLFYDRGLKQFPPTGTLLPAVAANNPAALSFVSSTQCGSGTCVKRALLEAANLLGDRGVIRFRGSGCTTCPGANPDAYLQQTLRELEARISGTRIRIEADIEAGCPEFARSLLEFENVVVNVITR